MIEIFFFQTGIVWMRPKDVNPNARFTGPSGYKFDMDYGALGNCW